MVENELVPFAVHSSKKKQYHYQHKASSAQHRPAQGHNTAEKYSTAAEQHEEWDNTKQSSTAQDNTGSISTAEQHNDSKHRIALSA
jgi:hypothetical protein